MLDFAKPFLMTHEEQGWIWLLTRLRPFRCCKTFLKNLERSKVWGEFALSEKKGFLIFSPQSLRKLRKIYLICFSRKVSISLPNLCEYELLAPGQENADRKLDENDQLGLRVIASFGNHSVAIINFYMSNPTKLYHFHIKVFDIIFSVYFLYKIYNCRICKKISPFIS